MTVIIKGSDRGTSLRLKLLKIQILLAMSPSIPVCEREILRRSIARVESRISLESNVIHVPLIHLTIKSVGEKGSETMVLQGQGNVPVLTLIKIGMHSVIWLGLTLLMKKMKYLQLGL